jgi:hypothetical protein
MMESAGKRVTRQKRKYGYAQPPPPTNCKHTVSFDEQESLPFTTPNAHYHMSNDVRHKLNISSWLGENLGDPTLQVSLIHLYFTSLTRIFQDFLPRLKNHILGRILEQDYDGDETEFTSAKRNTVVFSNNRLYRHKVLRVNYTTYDLRREQDSLNPRTHANVMVLSHEDDDSAHPYWYARIIGNFHATVHFKGLASHPTIQPGLYHIDFLWVRWYGRDLTHNSGWKAKRLHRLGFINSQDPGAFGFIDPKHIIRAVHLIPAYAFGTVNDLLPPSIVRSPYDNDRDWMYYYIAM